MAEEIIDWDQVTNPIELATEENPIIVCKLRGRGYSVTNTATDLFYVASELKFDRAKVILENGKSYKGSLYFGNSKKAGITLINKKGKIPILTERAGRLKIRGSRKSRKLALNPGAVAKVVNF